MTTAERAPAEPSGDGRGEALDALGRAFKAVLAAARRLRGRETHHPGELSYAQYSLLFELGEGERRSARELAGAAELSPACVTQMLDALAAAGLVERTRSEDDKRVVLTGLTAHGGELIAERRAQLEPRWRAALAGFSDDELRTTAAVLERLRHFFEGIAEDRPAPPAPERR